MRIAVVLPRWVGDACMATPLLRALRGHFGAGATIAGVMRPVIADLLEGTDWIDEIVPYDRHGGSPRFGFRAAAATLRHWRADVALVLPGSLSAAALAYAGRARRRVGFAGRWRRLLLTDPLPGGPIGRDPEPPPPAYLRLGAAIGATSNSARLQLATTPADEARADAVLARLFDGDGPLVILNDNSSNGAAKSWGISKHAALARWLADRLPQSRILVHCGPADRPQARATVAEAASDAVRGLGDVDEIPLGLSKALYRRACLAVTSDSGPRHIAAAFGVPTVAIMGPTNPRVGRSDPTGCVEIRLDLPCSPCGARECPLGHHDCMALVSVDDVGRAALAALDRAAASPREAPET